MGGLADAQVDELVMERERLIDGIAELDKIRLTATHAINGRIDESDAKLEIVCRADGYHGHDPFGPPYAPMSAGVPSTSSNTGSEASMSADPAPR